MSAWQVGAVAARSTDNTRTLASDGTMFDNTHWWQLVGASIVYHVLPVRGEGTGCIRHAGVTHIPTVRVKAASNMAETHKYALLRTLLQ